MNDTTHRSVRGTAKVTVSESVDGTVARRVRSTDKRPRARTVRSEQADPKLLRAAKAALRPGQRIIVVSASEIRVVNK